MDIRDGGLQAGLLSHPGQHVRVGVLPGHHVHWQVPGSGDGGKGATAEELQERVPVLLVRVGCGGFHRFGGVSAQGRRWGKKYFGLFYTF